MPVTPVPRDGRRGRRLVIGLLGVAAVLAGIAFKYRTSAWRPTRPIPTLPSDRGQNLPQ